MNNHARNALVLALGAMLLAPMAPALAEDRDDPIALMLSWRQDPTTTMLIDWQTKDEVAAPGLAYRESGAGDWHGAVGDSRPFPFSDRTVHRVELTGLEPRGDYEFRFHEEGRVYRFRTAPADLTEPLRFVTGGDVRHRQEWMEQTNRVAMKYDPDFILWGGDLAYADGREDRAYRWHEWFDAYKNTLVGEDGRVIPVLSTLGNHEVRGGYYYRDDGYAPSDAWREGVSPYFYAFFAFPGHPGYGVLDFGDYLSLVLLDSDHNNPVEGAQTEWLARTLRDRAEVPHVFPVYHVPGFPSHRSFDGEVSERVREYWVPLFEEHGVKVAFENHDHTYKRTHPIRGGEVARDGVVYIGDGAWGVGTRDVPDPEEVWYLKRAESKRHVIVVTLQGRSQHFLVVDEDGVEIDQYPEGPAAE